MSTNTAELTLLIQARNLVDVELSKVKASLNKLTLTAKDVARDMADAFKRVGARIGNALGNIAEDVLTGGNVQTSLFNLGALMAGAAVEGLSARFIPMILTKVMATAAFAPLAAAMAAGGVTLGSVAATAIAVGMAAFPFILLGILVAALVYLATNPEARNKAKEIALMVIGKIGDGLRALPGFLGDIFRKALTFVATVVGDAIRAVIKFFLDLPGKIRTAITVTLPNIFRNALSAIWNRVKRFVGDVIAKIRAIPGAVADAMRSILSLGNANVNVKVHGIYPGKAAGGWVGLNGPETVLVGEKGPEYVVPNHKLDGMGGGGGQPAIIQLILDGRKVAEVVDERLYYALRDASPTVGRT